MASSINNSAWVDWMARLMGGVSRQAHSATFPPDRYYCLLDELPVHLIPYSAFTAWPKGPGRRLFLNSNCGFYAGGEVPAELGDAKELFSTFSPQGRIAWVRNQKCGWLMPFWLGPTLELVVRELNPEEPIPDSVPMPVRTILERAGILAAADDTSEGKVATEAAFRSASDLFRHRGYAPLHGLIHPFHIAALRRYYRHRIRTGTIPLGDFQSPRRYVSYNDPVARFFHRQIAKRLSAVVGEPIKPSYVYLASYLSGAELKKHIDREQCEFSITLCLDFSPEPELATPWPICLDTPTGKVTVYQSLGDGLAYRGTRLPHYRSPLPEGQASTSIFFHYVSVDFKGSLD